MPSKHLSSELTLFSSLTHLRQDSSHVSFRHQKLEDVNLSFTRRYFHQFSNQYSISGTASDGFWSFKCTKVCLPNTVRSALSRCSLAGAFKDPINLYCDSVAGGARVERPVPSNPLKICCFLGLSFSSCGLPAFLMPIYV